MRRRIPSAALLLLSLLRSWKNVSAKFDPYQLNGGLVSAVAGRDYVIIAGDTRLTDGGYQIQSRKYLDGRIWAATDSESLLLPPSDANRPGKVEEHTGVNMNTNSNLIFGVDGSLRIPQNESGVPVVSDLAEYGAAEIPTRTNHTFASKHYRLVNNPFGLTMIGAAGCASDCEALKRVVRAELSDKNRWACPSAAALVSSPSSMRSPVSATTVATLLLHTLYSRRPFPYYSFCVLAGLDSETGTGQVHVYDAIGSHERVAVACAGTPGREMLQPVLDRMFASPRKANTDAPDVTRSTGNNLIRDGTALRASGQRAGSLSLRPPVGTCVSCDSDEAVAMLLKAYRSVSEREIGTGDDLVVCVLRRSASNRKSDAAYGAGNDCIGSVEVMRFPLKKH